MKPTTIDLKAETNVASTSFSMRMGREQLSKISHLLITNQYENPLCAALREIISNAYDANTVASYKDGAKRPVDITLKKDRVDIRDYGTGLSEEDMFSLYTLIGMSTKEDDNNQIGAFGVGRLAPLALNQTFFITSYFGGEKILYCCHLDEEHIPALSVWDREPSDEPSGLEVAVLFKEEIDSFPIFTYLYTLYLTELSRHTVRFSVGKELDKVITDSSYKFEIRGLLNSSVSTHKSYTLEDKKLGFTVDVYDASRQNAHDSYIDLGGALYKYEYGSFKSLFMGKADAYSSRMDYMVAKHSLNTNERSTEARLSSCQFYTSVVRVPPDYFKLSTSRETIVNSDEQTSKLKLIEDSVRELIVSEYQQKLDAETLKVDTQGMSLPDAVIACTLHFNKWNSRALNASYYPDRVLFNYNLPNGKRLAIGHHSVNDSSVLEDGTVCLEPYPAYFRAPSHYLLIDSQKLNDDLYSDHYLKMLLKEYKGGVYKRLPYTAQNLNLLGCLLTGLNIVSSNNRMLTHTQLAKHFGEDILHRPVLVTLSTHSLPLKDYLRYWGHFDGPETESKEEKTSKRKAPVYRSNPEDSVLLRQLKHNVEYSMSNLYWPRVIQPTKEEITLDLLKEKVIYRTGEIQYYESSLSKLPTCYFKNYSPYRTGISENLADKIRDLKSKGRCEWLSMSTVRDQLSGKIEGQLGLLAKFVLQRESFECFMVIGPILKEFIPEPTYNTLKWHPRFINKLRDFLCSDKLESTNRRHMPLYKPYIGEYCAPKGIEFFDTAKLVGPLVLPLLYQGAKSYQGSSSKQWKESLTEVATTYAIGLRQQGASILK